MSSQEVKILELISIPINTNINTRNTVNHHLLFMQIIEKIDGYENNPENSSTRKVSKHILSAFSMSIISSVRTIENNRGVHRGKNCMKNILESIREHAMKIINLKKNEVVNRNHMKKQKRFKFVEKNLKINIRKKNKIFVKDHCHYTGKYRGAAHRICILKYSAPKKIYIVFKNGSNYDYKPFYFIIKGLAERFKNQPTSLEENTEKYIAFTIRIKKKLQELIKMKKKLRKTYLTYYNLLIA